MPQGLAQLGICTVAEHFTGSVWNGGGDRPRSPGETGLRVPHTRKASVLALPPSLGSVGFTQGRRAACASQHFLPARLQMFTLRSPRTWLPFTRCFW